MGNINDYVETELRTFYQLPFSGVDSLVLCQFSYMNLGEALPIACLKDGPAKLPDLFKAELFPTLFEGINFVPDNRRLLAAVVASPRFRDLRVSHYINTVDTEKEEQFSCETFVFDNDDVYIAFRGTDLTFVGWKENFNMAFRSPVPAQVESVKYLEDIASRHPGRIILGGHSKGGNLAVYAATKCAREVQDRVVAIFDHDGPGFDDGLLESEDFARIKGRTFKTMPREALIGMLFDHQEDYSVVDSTGIGILQHNAFTWKVEGDGFVYSEKISGGAAHTSEVLRAWMGGLSDDEREIFSDTLYKVLQASGVDSFADLSHIKFGDIVKSVAAFNACDEKTRKVVLDTFGALIQLQLALPQRIGDGTKDAKDTGGDVTDDGILLDPAI